MTKKEAFQLLKCNGKDLAHKLGITPSAIYQWPDPIPIEREYQIRDLAVGKEPILNQTKTPAVT